MRVHSGVLHGMVLSVALVPGLVPVQEVQLSLAWSSRTLYSRAMRSTLCGLRHSLLLGFWNLIMYVSYLLAILLASTIVLTTCLFILCV